MSEYWMTVIGAWGDSLACYGNICKYCQNHNIDKTNVVYYGLHPEIVNFLKHQKYIDKVSYLHLTEPVRTENGLNSKVFFDFFQSLDLVSKSFAGWMQATGLEIQIPDLIPTYIGKYYNDNPTECNRDFEVILPEISTNWKWLKEPYLLFQPYSCQSCPPNMHWMHWMPALEWLAETVNCKIVMTGTLTSAFFPDFIHPTRKHPNIIDLVGKTKSVLDVFHIMKNAKGIITTSNVLSMWSIITNKPTLVVCNKLIQKSYFYHWINFPPNTVLDCDTTLTDFKEKFKEVFHDI